MERGGCQSDRDPAEGAKETFALSARRFWRELASGAAEERPGGNGGRDPVQGMGREAERRNPAPAPLSGSEWAKFRQKEREEQHRATRARPLIAIALLVQIAVLVVVLLWWLEFW